MNVSTAEGWRLELGKNLADLLGEKAVDLAPLGAGGNNRVYKILGTADHYIAKVYFRDADGQHDRLRSEWAFTRYARQCGIGNVPRPIALDERARIGVYSLVEGVSLASPPESRHVKAAADFFLALNSRQNRNKAAHLPFAAEAAFSVDHHLKIVFGRLERLAACPKPSVTDSAFESILSRMQHCYDRIENSVLRAYADSRAEMAQELQREERCVSPSDFGFHNALVTPSGRVCFIDFEYSGWDDPAKMVCDFFWQPSRKVPVACRDAFLDSVMTCMADPDGVRRRINILNSLYGLKWCCIMLNVFLPAHSARPVFADPNVNLQDLRQHRLASASEYLNMLESV